MIRNAKVMLAATTLAMLVISALFKEPQIAHAQTAHGASIHGYVGAMLVSDTPAIALPTRVINLPDIQVIAKSIRGGVTSAPVQTNPQGYFRTGTLPPGVYQICVAGTGYTSSCDDHDIEIVNSTHVMDHTVLIRPAAGAIDGTVRLADQNTPCFWFRPAFSTATVVAAQVSLVDGGGNVVAGPVNGNSVGQYVLPVAASRGPFALRATCQSMSSSLDVTFPGAGILQRDIVIGNSPPHIASLGFTKGGAGVRIANPGDVLQSTVVATDPDGDTLHYQWTDDSGRSLGLPDAPTVNWPVQNKPALNTLRVQVSDGKGGFAVSQQSLRAGASGILFDGNLVGRLDGQPITNATVTLNGVSATSNVQGKFQVQVPNASRFVLNISKPGYALVSRVYYGQANALQILLDATQSATVSARTGGRVQMVGDCDCDRDKDHDWDKHTEQWKRHRHRKHCTPTQTSGNLLLTLQPNSLVDASGNPFNRTATVEMFQYDTTLPNPIPGDQGAISSGKAVRLSTFGAFYIQPRDNAGKPLQMAAGKTANITMPIEPTLLAKATATVPFLRYDESTGLWTELGTLTRSGNNYVGSINHFSVFNADTEFPGGACVKVILDPDTFTALPYALDATYVDPSNGQFNHNGTQVTANPIGVERMVPNVNFTLDVYDSTNTVLLKSVTLNSGPGLDPAAFPTGLDTDTVNFSHCNGPVTIFNNNVPTGPTFLVPITGGVIQDNSVSYQNATNAGSTGNRFTLPDWLSVNGFTGTEPQAVYFNNADLKFGRNMHCRVTASGTTACYVSNYGSVGENDSVQALADVRASSTPVATVTMEYDPGATGQNVQFWAYDGGGNYLAHPALDGQGGKPIPEICLACHGGTYSGGAGAVVQNAIFLPFDLDSFLYDTQGDPHSGSPNFAAVQEQFRQLNNIVLNTNPDGLTGDNNKPVTQLMDLWYPGAVQNPGQQFVFGNAVAAKQGGFPANGPLYDNVVKPVCRTCHLAQGQSLDWTSYSQMTSLKGLIQGFACGGGTPAAHQTTNFAMPHGQVPLLVFWQNSLSSTLDSELSFLSPGCPNQ